MASDCLPPHPKPSNLFFVAGQKPEVGIAFAATLATASLAAAPCAFTASRRLLPHLRHNQSHHHRAHAAATTIAAAALAATATESICYVMYHACVRSWSGVVSWTNKFHNGLR